MSYTDLAYEDIGTVGSTYMREELVGKVQERVNDGQVWVLSRNHSRAHQQTLMLIVLPAVSISDHLRVNAADTVPRLTRLSRRRGNASCQR